MKVGDSIWIKPTGEGPFIIIEKWGGVKKNNKSVTSEPCLVVCKPDAKPMGVREGGYWFGSPAAEGCSIILEAVCSNQPPNKEPSRLEKLLDAAVLSVAEDFGFWSTMAVMFCAVAAVVVSVLSK